MEGENKATRIKQLYGLLYSGLQTDFGHLCRIKWLVH